ncbi:MAG: hypothetical protein NUV55_06945 [Sulfuricaulis sp.]|nr:hypothetical protein [Sulfuricaulis sp.]
MRHTGINAFRSSVHRNIRKQKPSQFFIVLSGFLALIFASYPPPIAAGSQCWVGELGGNTIGVHSLGPYPDRDAILAAAKFKMDELLLGKPYNDHCYPINPSLPFISTQMTCNTVNCDIDSCDYRTGVCTPWISVRTIWASSELANCNLASLYAHNDALSSKPSPACAGSYTIRLSPGNNASETALILTSIEPDEATDLVAKVYDQNNQLVPNVVVKLALEAKQNSGGHHHGNDSAIARTGTLAGQQVLTDNTGPSGLQFSYKAPSVAGDYKIKATCTDGKNCQPEGADTVWVGVKNLIPLSGQNSVYRLIGQNQQHPDNHYLKSTALNRATVFAAFYQAKYPNTAVLYLNDASLERGGVFDISLDWKSPHFEHCHGTIIDIRANGGEGALNITSDNDPMIEKLKEIGRVAGVEPDFEIPKDKEGNRLWNLRHFHTYLMGQEGLQCP